MEAGRKEGGWEGSRDLGGGSLEAEERGWGEEGPLHSAHANIYVHSYVSST